MIFGQLAVSRKLVSTAQIQAALSEQREMTEQVPIGEVLVRRGCLTERQRLVILEAQRQLQRGSKRCVVVDERGMTEGCRFGPYDNLREISRGGMGIVYRAEHLNLRRTVALKTLSPEFSERAELVKRFVREAQALAQMAHPNIVQIHNVGLN